MIKDGDIVAASGLGLACWAEEMGISIEERFLQTDHPRNLTVVHSSGVGNRRDKGMSHLGYGSIIAAKQEKVSRCDLVTI